MESGVLILTKYEIWRTRGTIVIVIYETKINSCLPKALTQGSLSFTAKPNYS